ncbi:hypothetical protein DUNSADRAFT_8392 [Dunaliella salina]|uniref:Protein-S-isoprenylcysteine O-methyltransferase n=1 Tax=Dunaliella salina TaxID=3046 RepID=A0ABQ7GJM8_DUNSA|nr:hypothetical protein DUNSADRAFT_8392 [Dunaliella salina]|eukprot:KAF5834808.1 hypothetical protein DUNSADRAFT_8392 [Dunaliella salina]
MLQARLPTTTALPSRVCKPVLMKSMITGRRVLPQRYTACAAAANSGSAEQVSSSEQPAKVEATEMDAGALPRQQQPPQSESDGLGSQELIDELKTGFGSKGEVYLFAQLGMMALVVFCPFEFQGFFHTCAAVSLATGLAFLYLGQNNLGRNLSPMPQPREKHQLVTTGVYSYVRHPMYAGLLLAAIGLADLTHSETRLALAVGLWLVLEKKVAQEEKYLCERYPDYTNYMGKVKKFFPFLY